MDNELRMGEITSADEAKRLLDNAAEIAAKKAALIERLKQEIEDRKSALRALGVLRARKAVKRGPGRPKGSKSAPKLPLAPGAEVTQ